MKKFYKYIFIALFLFLLPIIAFWASVYIADYRESICIKQCIKETGGNEKTCGYGTCFFD